MKQDYLFILEGMLYIIGGVLLSLNFFSNTSGIGPLFVLGIVPLSAGTVLTGLREKRRGNMHIFNAHIALATGIMSTGVSGYLPANIYTDITLLIGLTLIGASTIYIWSKSVIPRLRNVFER